MLFTLCIYEELQPVLCDLRKKISHECGILVVIFFLQTFIQENLDTATLFYYNGQTEKYTQEVFNISHGDCYEHV